ncbi:MAG: ATP-binding protein [Holosporaceae bacterium]|jgi:predicted AAA+ superfamily ATPase|nr:ATP-binding protein [Holosporaceae bacterium]
MFERTLRKVIEDVSSSFPVLLLTGPRQVGKTTLLEYCASKNHSYVTLDDLDERTMAQNDPMLFLQTHTPPVIIDEVQYAPGLFSYIKMYVDKHKRPGDFWLTGSQKFHLMKGITESLAGRVAIIDMLGLSAREIAENAAEAVPFLPTSEWIAIAGKNPSSSSCVDVIYEKIWSGSFPKLLQDGRKLREMFYRSYVQTYLEKDVRSIIGIGNELAFYKFLRATAARTGQLLNYSELARDVDVDQKTAKSWLSVLRTSGLVHLLEPYYNNITKRIIKTPKLYFLDTGLCAFLTGWDSPKTLEAGAMNGAILETYIFREILKSYWHNGKHPHMYFYRDTDQREIDFVFEINGILYPAEVKKTATPSLAAAKSFFTLETLGKPIGAGAVICLREKDIPLSREVTAIPVGYL